jgi:hypothetical protein
MYPRFYYVIPAYAGIQDSDDKSNCFWIPAFAGMTVHREAGGFHHDSSGE